MDLSDDAHLDVCQDIETGLKRAYEHNPDLTDMMCIFALDNAKIAIKKHFGFAKNETVSTAPEIQGVVDWCVKVADERVGKVNDLTLRELTARMDKVARSIRRHAQDGRRSYYEFITHFLP